MFRIIDEYDRAARDLTRDATQGLRGFLPKFDVKETKESYELHGELPGVEQKDIDINWQDGNSLSISGHVEHRSERKKGFVEGEDNKSKSKQPTVEDEKEGGEKETAVTTTESKEVQKKSEDEGRYWITERSVGEFHRSFSFPSPVDHDNVKATLKNGVLTVIVPKARRTQPKRIAIE